MQFDMHCLSDVNRFQLNDEFIPPKQWKTTVKIHSILCDDSIAILKRKIQTTFVEKREKCYDHEMLQFRAFFFSLFLHSSILHSFESITHSLFDDLVHNKKCSKTSEHALHSNVNSDNEFIYRAI